MWLLDLLVCLFLTQYKNKTRQEEQTQTKPKVQRKNPEPKADLTTPPSKRWKETDPPQKQVGPDGHQDVHLNNLLKKRFKLQSLPSLTVGG